VAIRATDRQRRRLAVKGKLLGHKLLGQIATSFTPDTSLHRHRELIFRNWDFSHRRQPSRHRILEEIVELIVQFARENPTWGYERIQGTLGIRSFCLGCVGRRNLAENVSMAR
jgi:hypothetical protein